eukprot:CAMPEP_0202709370 /NCGR_PEP_ID=MMETSP1385-20130828/21496_1 /ASSEMBLY_ACC=CAM_ASM_000861 /TAXON_ID=933848 /ORGANISM="Elphidium margaritaceum" /LENGTH=323 /DNA_ID=CAMNT_0049368621 /DNA_START=158 /DNA_END=1126 /DNA_ORIENTATION=-
MNNSRRSRRYISPDLRNSCVELWKSGNNYQDIANRLLLSQSACWTYVDRYQRIGHTLSDKEILQKEGLYRHPVDRIMDEPFARQLVQDVLQDKPTTYLKEYQQSLGDVGISASVSTLCRHFKEEKETRKKASILATESSFEDWERFWTEVDAVYTHPGQGTWLDEMSVNDLDTNRTHGRSKKGTRVLQSTNLSRGNFRFSLELCGDLSGPMEYEAFDGAVDSLNFVDFLWSKLYDHVGPYPGPHSILFLDNHTVHKVDEFDEFIRESGMINVWLPAYMPYTNLAEYMFNGIRSVQKANDTEKGYHASLEVLCNAVEAMKHKQW